MLTYTGTMDPKITIRESYTSAFSNPIRICSGETVTVAEEYHGDPGWKNWIWCTHQQTGKQGWVPKQYLEINGNQARVLADFNARELTVNRGDRVYKIITINGWAWVERDQEYGWIPESCISGGKID